MHLFSPTQAKFGVSMHWGVYSVPAFSIPYSGNALGEWYGNYIGEAAKDRTPAHNPVQAWAVIRELQGGSR